MTTRTEPSSERATATPGQPLEKEPLANNGSHPIVEDETFDEFDPGLVQLLLVSAFAGCLVGLAGGAFHWGLNHGSSAFLEFLRELRTEGTSAIPGWLIAMLIAGVSVGLARYLVKFAPVAAGSGVQHVEAVMRGDAKPAGLIVLPIKFFGGLLAMVPGLALGREGPTIQMAAVIGTQCGKIFGLQKEDRTLLYTAIAGSGLSVAFNAPLSGAAFVIEEVAKRITVRRVLATLTAVATGMAVYRGFFGDQLSFTAGDVAQVPGSQLIFFVFLGMVMGLLGVLYNRSILFAIDAYAAIAPNTSPWIKTGCIGALFGLMGYYHPVLVGSGEMQVNVLLAGQYGTYTLLLLLAVRWILGPLSYTSGTPGGVFAPLLLVGAIVGSLFAQSLNLVTTDMGIILSPEAFALVAMAAFFTGVVRAPITGVLLICEMSGTVSLMIPLLLASVSSAVVASLLRGDPIYDSLRARMHLSDNK